LRHTRFDTAQAIGTGIRENRTAILQLRRDIWGVVGARVPRYTVRTIGRTCEGAWNRCWSRRWRRCRRWRRRRGWVTRTNCVKGTAIPVFIVILDQETRSKPFEDGFAGGRLVAAIPVERMKACRTVNAILCLLCNHVAAIGVGAVADRLGRIRQGFGQRRGLESSR
jgi:hypothetical protein